MAGKGRAGSECYCESLVSADARLMGCSDKRTTRKALVKDGLHPQLVRENRAVSRSCKNRRRPRRVNWVVGWGGCETEGSAAVDAETITSWATDRDGSMHEPAENRHASRKSASEHRLVLSSFAAALMSLHPVRHPVPARLLSPCHTKTVFVFQSNGMSYF